MIKELIRLVILGYVEKSLKLKNLNEINLNESEEIAKTNRYFVEGNSFREAPTH